MSFQIIQASKAPKLPPVMSISALTLLMPSLLILANFPNTLNAVAVVGLVVAVVLDRVSLRNSIRLEHEAGQEMLRKYIEQANAAQPASSTDEATPRVPKNKDGETLQ